MANPEEEWQSAGSQRIDDVDPSDQANGAEDSINGTALMSGSLSVTRRLTEIIAEDGDLLLQRSDREDGVLQWLRALDMQVMGACRADERLKPLLKLSTATDFGEDPLIAHLSQHFEPAEVGMLARCLCVPLVSIRVGKINKEGTLLFPTSTRGNLCLVLLPTSDLRLSFNGDDGCVEKLATLSSEARRNDTEIEEISTDKSGRSFSIKNSDGLIFYFWCSEKSKLLGKELLRKMKDLLIRRPPLAELSGISDSRLNCFAAHFRAYVAGSMSSSAEASGILAATHADDSSEIHLPQPSSGCEQSLHPHASQGSTTNLGLSSFKEKGLSTGQHGARENLRQHEESDVPCDKDSTILADRKNKPSEANGPSSFALLKFLDAIGKAPELPHLDHEKLFPSSGPSHFSPNHCWCPPSGPAAQYPPQVPISASESFTLPPLSSLLSGAGPSVLLTSKPLLNLGDIPSIDFTGLPSEPLLRLPGSQQIPTFTPLMCDPIVHIPVIDVCSSGQGYLVSASPAISTTIPTLNLNMVDPLLTDGESVLEKSARETLCMLLSSSSGAPVLDKENAVVGGSRGLYSGTQDVGIGNGVGLVVLSECFSSGGDDMSDQMENQCSCDPWISSDEKMD